jgi:hypothetical protein
MPIIPEGQEPATTSVVASFPYRMVMQMRAAAEAERTTVSRWLRIAAQEKLRRLQQERQQATNP